MKRVVYKTKFFVTMMLFAIAGCGDDEHQPSNITVENKDALNQTVYADETPTTVSFVTKGAWTSSISEGTSKSTVSWIFITPDSGNEAGEYAITIALTPNATSTDRSATITISCDGTTITVKVTQKATKRDGTSYDPDITVTNGAALAQTVYAAETPEALSFITKGAWTSTKTATWVSLSPSQGSVGSHTIAFILVPNDTGTDRATTITITCGETSITVNITQKATNRDGTPYDPNATPKGDVYVVGYKRNTQNIEVATVWKNGVAHELTDGVFNTTANSIYVSGGDVYVAGVEYNGSRNVARLWKNDVEQNLSDGFRSSGATSVFVSGNNVYVAGHKVEQNERVATLWKNGVEQNLNTSAASEAYSVYVSGSDVYVAGYEFSIGSDIFTAKLWKNGVGETLATGAYRYSRVEAHSVFVSGSDVYVAGIESNDNARNFAKLWKNGVVQYHLTDVRGQGDLADAHSVFASGNDVYVAGYEYKQGNKGILWKNGVAQVLTEERGVAYSVFVSGSDVYVAGYEGRYDEQEDKWYRFATLWKNGVAQDITDGTNESEAYSVFVVE